MPEERKESKESGRSLDVKDVSRLIEQNVSILHEIDRSLQGMRNELGSLLGRTGAAALGPGFAGAAGLPYRSLESLGMYGPASPTTTMASPLGFAALNVPTYYGWEGMGITSRPTTTWPATPIGSSISPHGDGKTFTLTRDLKTMPPQTRVPNVDVIDEGNEYTVRVELAGVKKDQLELFCFERSVTVSARSNIEEDEGSVLLAERGPIQYRRTIPLPTEVHPSQCKAALKDGILSLRITKKVPGETPRRVDVAYT